MEHFGKAIGHRSFATNFASARVVFLVCLLPGSILVTGLVKKEVNKNWLTHVSEEEACD